MKAGAIVVAVLGCAAAIVKVDAASLGQVVHGLGTNLVSCCSPADYVDEWGFPRSVVTQAFFSAAVDAINFQQPDLRLK